MTTHHDTFEQLLESTDIAHLPKINPQMLQAMRLLRDRFRPCRWQKCGDSVSLTYVSGSDPDL